MHSFNGDGFYEHFMILFTIYHLLNIYVDFTWNVSYVSLSSYALSALAK